MYEMDSQQIAVTKRNKRKKNKKVLPSLSLECTSLDVSQLSETEPSNQLKLNKRGIEQKEPTGTDAEYLFLNTSHQPKQKIGGKQVTVESEDSVLCETSKCQVLTQNENSVISQSVGLCVPLKKSVDNKSIASYSEVFSDSSRSSSSNCRQNVESECLQKDSINENIEKFFNYFRLENSASNLGTGLEAAKAHFVLYSEDSGIQNTENHLCPIYANCEIQSPVSVTTSICNSQLSHSSKFSSKVCGSSVHQYEESASDCPNLFTSEMNSSFENKSRTEVEAERKARKAAKQAAKGKGKVLPQEKDGSEAGSSISSNLQGSIMSKKSKEERSGVEQNSKQSKSSAPKSCAEKLTDSLQKLQLTQNSNQIRKPKAADEPDFVRMDQPEFSQILGAIPTIPLQYVTKGKSDLGPNSTADVKQPPELSSKDDSGKSKAELRAERRAKQEAQRAAKAGQQQQANQPKQKQQPCSSVPQISKPPTQVKPAGAKPAKEAKDAKASTERRVKLFSHLYQNSFKSISHIVGVNHPQYHPAIVRLGVQYANRTILGSNARCIALLYALKEIISDYITPPEKEFSRGLEGYLHPNIEFLQQCRPQSVSMVNAMRYVKWQLTQLSNSVSDFEAKQKLHEAIEQYIFEQIDKAAEAIGTAVEDKIVDNDVILVYACSSLVLSALKKAFDGGRQFRVVVVDSLPWLEGREMLRRLVSMGVRCSYVHISAASFVMREVSKVLLGAHALLANGYVMSRAGSSQVALLAHTYNVPVLVCCETHKFSERVQTDSFVYNELGNPDELIGARRAGEREAVRERPLANWRALPHLSLLNLVYDVTPPDLVTAVVTERAILPCTSVPVILRIKPIEC